MNEMLSGIRYATVIFDCDSTLSAIEGIEELARARGADVAGLTEAAMRGEIPLEAVYGRRLELAAPSLNGVVELGRLYIERLVPDARDTVAALRAEGVDVRIVSGGLLPAVLPLAVELGLPVEAVAAVGVEFDPAGEYLGFDRASPLVRSGGKLEVLRAWTPPIARPSMLVGDGATDLEAADAVDLFVAFAGVVDRPEVTRAAPVVVRAPSLAPILPLALGGAPPASAAARELFDKGLALLDLAE